MCLYLWLHFQGLDKVHKMEKLGIHSVLVLSQSSRLPKIRPFQMETVLSLFKTLMSVTFQSVYVGTIHFLKVFGPIHNFILFHIDNKQRSGNAAEGLFVQQVV